MNEEKIMRSIFDFFDPSLPRLAPGDHRSTRRALEILYGQNLKQAEGVAEILDIGCGNGSQTMSLLRELDGKVTATDIHQPFLDEVQKRARELGMQDRVKTLCADMKDLDLEGKTFDLVWAEGSVFVMGVSEAMKAWHSYLKPGGALGFTELTWIAEGAPEECRKFLEGEYPQMTDVKSNLAIIEAAGFELAGRFTLPESCWLEDFHGPLEKRLAEYQSPWDDDEARAVAEMVRREIPNYRKFSTWYGYEFFLLRKAG